MLHASVFVSFEEAHAGGTPAGSGPQALTNAVEHPHPISATADAPSHVVYGVILFLLLLAVLLAMWPPVARWRQRAGGVSGRASATSGAARPSASSQASSRADLGG